MFQLSRLLIYYLLIKVIIAARRGIVQSAFWVKELRELYKLKNLDFYILRKDLEKSLNPQSLKEIEIKDQYVIFKLQFLKNWKKKKKTRHNRRKYKFIEENFKILETAEEFQNLISKPTRKRNIIFRYFLAPVKFNGEDKIESVEFCESELTGPAFNQNSVILQNGKKEIINCDVCIKSIGYQAEQIDPSINFDNKNHVILNSNGCVISEVFFVIVLKF